MVELQSLIDAAVDGVILTDQHGRMLALNRAAERLFGYTAAQLLGHNVSLLMAEPDRSAHVGYMERYLATLEPHVIGKGREVEARRRDGGIFPVLLSLGLIPGSEPLRFVGFLQDITERRRAEAETLKLQDRLTYVSRLATVGEMSSGIAHELNQPLAAVANYAQACDRLLGLPTPDIAEVRDALREITAQAVRAGDIIRRLRGRTHHDVMRREPTDISTLIHELTELMHIDAKTHDVRLRLELADGLPAANIDRAQVQQVVLNLVRNAVEALEDNTNSAREVVVRTGLSHEGEVELSVCDNGPGIPREIASCLFDPFCSSKPHGAGLGLAMSRRIIKSHAGTLDYRPNTPRGACFTVHLPCLRKE